MTIIYAIPPSSSSSFKMGSPAYKLVHFVANSVTDAELWRATLEKFKEGRVAKAITMEEGESQLGSEGCSKGGDEHKVVREEEVHTLCARLGMGMSKGEISEAFKVSSILLPSIASRLSLIL